MILFGMHHVHACKVSTMVGIRDNGGIVPKCDLFMVLFVIINVFLVFG